jgi:Phage protein (N4 Gp49/phage Sf6 gene 66) family
MTKPSLLTNEELDKALAASPAERVTKEYMESRIASTDFTRLAGTVTICSITLDNGYSVRGESACVNPENYNQQIGEKIAYDQAFGKLWPLFGFLLAEKNKLAAAEKEAA